MAKKVSKAEFKKTAAARTVDISQTQWVGGKKAGFGVAGPKNMAGRLYGPKGRFYTGTVNLGEGKTAVYKEGKRVKPGKIVSSPQSSSGSAKTSSSTPVAETKTLPPTRTNTVGSGYTTGASSRTGSAAPAVSPTRRLEGPPRSMPVSSPRTKVNPAGTMTGEQRRASTMRKTAGFVRGVKGSSTAMNRPKGASLSGALQRKRAEDTRNQVRNAVVIGSLPLIAAGGVAGVSGTVGRALAGRVAAEQIAVRASQIRASAQAAARNPAASRPAAQAPKPSGKPTGTTKGVSKVSGGALKNGKPANYGPRKPTAAQMAQSRRKAAAQRAAATRRANAAKTARGRKKP